MEAHKKVTIFIGNSNSELRFCEFYEAFLRLSGANVLARVNKQRLILETSHFYIQYLPNDNPRIIQGKSCDIAIGFDVGTKRYLEKNSELPFKDLEVVSDSELRMIEKIIEIERKGTNGDEGN